MNQLLHKKAFFRILLLTTIFSIAMGFMESAIVVYLRKIYYPGGFHFPLVPIEPHIALIEFLREGATIIMLLIIGGLAGKNRAERFAYFIYCFAIWDIFYYVFLWALLGWPASLFTWDILFLIPVPWVGPVLAPCLVSLTMILFTFAIIYYQEINEKLKISRQEGWMIAAGSVVLFISFIWDYMNYMLTINQNGSIWSPDGNQKLFQEIANYTPQHFNWWMFAIGELIILFALTIFVSRMQKEN